MNGLYQVSNLGNVRSLDKYVRSKNNSFKLCKGKVLKMNVSTPGYLYVGLHKNGYFVKKTVHRLVASAFLQNPCNLPCVNHKDENKLNNCVENLEWCSYKYNMEYSNVLEKSILKKSFLIANKESVKVCSKPVIQYTQNGQFVNEYKSISEASDKNKICNVNIGKVCNGKRKTAGGYIWKYKTSTEN